MDRGRHRPFLKIILLTGLTAVGAFAGVGSLRPQENAGSPPPAVASPVPSPSAIPDAAGRKRAVERMMERRQQELAAGEREAQRKIDQLPPEERDAFKRNLRLWRELSPEEREVMRKETNERMRAEIDKALLQSGLHLDKDQREVFALRYRQERSKLERELQQKLEAERARRLPVIIDGLKKEFADKSGASPAPTAKPVPSAATPGPSVKASPSVSVASPTLSR